ncbi:hypothetical protein JIN84_03640 [Luteolibacter yonseiensis]|uniref:Uncharacterized protein n=1 Tax=Luteolibacter yonseiensis TaxID=1144680 RepID=A0A934R3M7_9BACT|nr:hypothetical protein [Luteolibacter yonseiensis]MBK1814690.1 hypothetical protein [Luteolibacter yonseiensis]
MNPKRLVFCLIAFSSHTHAAIFAREDFNYINGNLSGSNGGLGWSSGWTNAAGVPTVTGGKGTVDAITNQQGARLISELQEPPLGGTKIVWVSFEALQSTNAAPATATNSYGGLGLYRNNTEQLLIGKAWPGPYEWRAGVGGTLVGPAVPVSTLALTKIIARITMVDAATDTLDVWINPADTSSVAALGAPQITRTDADLSFNTLRIRAGEGDAAVTSESWTFDAVTAGDELADVVASDSDADGMLDAWELANGLVVGVNDAGGDPDTDNSSNLREYQRSTDPHNPDTDGDSISDGAESGTGIYVNASDTGTNPLLVDTDGDKFYDYEETNSGVFVDESNPGTNPNLADTDGDSHNDYFEMLRGTDPNSAASFPSAGDLAVVGTDAFAYEDGAVAGLAGGTGFDYDNSTANDPYIGHVGLGTSNWDDVSGTNAISGGRLVTLGGGVKREFNGPGGGAVAGSDEHVGAVNQDASTQGRVVYFRADMKRGEATTWSGISALDFGVERAFAGVPGVVNPASGNYEFGIGAPSPAPVYSGISPVIGRDYTLVVKLDYENDLISLWVNPDLTAPEPAPTLTAPFTLTQWTTGFRLASGGTDGTEWDHAVVARQWSALSIFPGVIPTTDDYLSWIGGYAVGSENGFDQDPDHDGLVNGVEHLLGSSPADANRGVRDISSATGGSFTFRHTRTNAMATDVTASYEWSQDLVNWHASGATAGGITATITDNVVTDTSAPALDEIEVSVTVGGGFVSKVFARLKADRH